MSFRDLAYSRGPNSRFAVLLLLLDMAHAVNRDTGFTHQHAILESLGNEDVEMQDSRRPVTAVIVLDTNILLHYLDMLSDFVGDVETLNLQIMFIVPGAVLNELDGYRQKNRKNDTNMVAWFARRASTWLRSKVEERRYVKVQALAETCRPSGNWKIRLQDEIAVTPERLNDDLIQDCCMFFARRGLHVALCSADNNLCTQCAAEGLYTVSPSSRDRTSRALANLIIGGDTSAYRTNRTITMDYKQNSMISDSNVAKQKAEDGMDVDVDESGLILQRDARISLHLQVIEHFTFLLIEIVYAVGRKEIEDQQARNKTVSMYAPSWHRNRSPIREWSALELLRYLDYKRKQVLKKDVDTSKTLGAFLSKPYTTATGARPGHEWSKEQWLIALREIKAVGDDLNDPSLQESLVWLEPHLCIVFDQQMVIE